MAAQPRPLQGKTLDQTSSDFGTTDSTKSHSQRHFYCDVCAKIDNHQVQQPQPRRYRIQSGSWIGIEPKAAKEEEEWCPFESPRFCAWKDRPGCILDNSNCLESSEVYNKTYGKWNPIKKCQPENQFKPGAYKGDKCIIYEEKDEEEEEKEEDEDDTEDEEDTFIPELDPCRSYNVVSECWRQPNCKYNPRKGCTDLDVGDDRDELKRLWDQRPLILHSLNKLNANTSEFKMPSVNTADHELNAQPVLDVNGNATLISLKNTTFEPVVKNYNFEDLSSRYSFVHIQHNIGPMSYDFNPTVFHTVKSPNGWVYTNPVKNKMSPNDVTRTISNYLIQTKQAQYPPADLYTLQEVQEQNEKGIIPVNSETYGYVYNQTGHLIFAQKNPNSHTPSTFPINHGCAVVYNTKRFRLVGTVSHDFNDRIDTRSTPWVVLEDKFTTKRYAVLSLHGSIASNFKNANKAIDIYNSLKSEIYFTLFSGLDIIIGSDLNINIFTPNLNPFNKLQSQKDIDSLNQLRFETQSLLQFMKESGISSVTDGTTATNYSHHNPNSFEESLDFIFNSNLYIIKDVLMSNLHRGSLLDIQNSLQQLKDDFDHSMLIVTCLDKDIIEDLDILSWSLGLPFSVDDSKKMSGET